MHPARRLPEKYDMASLPIQLLLLLAQKKVPKKIMPLTLLKKSYKKPRYRGNESKSSGVAT
jgi:hypothetical protein